VVQYRHSTFGYSPPLSALIKVVKDPLQNNSAEVAFTSQGDGSFFHGKVLPLARHYDTLSGKDQICKLAFLLRFVHEHE
jgi:hypothetical protein